MEKHFSLTIHNLSVAVSDVCVLHDINLSIASSSIHAIMGPNGSGKSSLAYALMGHPSYIIERGSIIYDYEDIVSKPVHERAQKGLFLAFQNPCEIPGVSVFSFLKEAYSAITGTALSVADFNILLHKRCAQLSIDPTFITRNVNVGFSGGEKKRLEMLQLLLLQPKVAVLDEIDSGLDIDALKIVAAGLRVARQENPHLSIILITHYRRILEYIKPDYVHVLHSGHIVASGDYSLVTTLETEGYDAFKK